MANNSAATLTEILGDVAVTVKATVGCDSIGVKDLARLKEGDIIHWGKPLGEPMELFIADKKMAKGDVVITNGKYSIRVTQVLTPRDEIITDL